MNDEGKARIRSLDAIRGYAIVMVVATHALTYTRTEINEVLRFWVQAAAVPPFFLVDGYLFVEGVQKQKFFQYGRYMSKSARRLLLPWGVFTLVYGLCRAGFEYRGLLETRVIVGRDIFSILEAIYHSDISAQMYFLLSLFVIRSLSFITKSFIKLHRIHISLIWLAYTILWASMAPDLHGGSTLDPIVHAGWGMQFYLAGVVLYVYRESVSKYPCVYACGAIVTLLLLQFGQVSPVSQQYAYILTLYFVSIAVQPYSGPFNMLGKVSMGVFLFHAPIALKAASMSVPAIIQTTDFRQYTLVVTLTLLASVLITKLCTAIPYGSLVLGETARTP